MENKLLFSYYSILPFKLGFCSYIVLCLYKGKTVDSSLASFILD